MNNIISAIAVFCYFLIAFSGAVSAHDSPPKVTFLGTTSLAFDDGTSTILIDGFCSRPPFSDLLKGKVQTNKGAVDRCLRIGAIEDVAAIFVAHSHYDHLLDVGYLAEKTKAKVYGSLSTRAVLRGQYENFKKVAHGQVEEIGHAQVRIFETAHSVPALYKGAITRPIAGRQRASRYRLGKNYSFFISYGHDPRFAALVVPSAGKVGETFRGLKANTVFLSIGMLGWRPSKEIEAYWNATVREVRAKNVYLIHWDDFRIPLTEPLRKMPFPPDRIDTALRTIKRLGERDRINVRLPRAFEEFILK